MAILRALRGKNVLHLGTPCTVFSIARHGITNTARARERERIGCELAFFTAELCRTATSLGIKRSIENPTTSRLWEFPAIRDLQCLPGVQFVNTVMCHFGAPYKKPTSLMTNILELRGLEAICEHRRHEVVLKGTVHPRLSRVWPTLPSRACKKEIFTEAEIKTTKYAKGRDRNGT